MTIPAILLDALLETINLGIGQAAGLLNRLVKSHVRLSVPNLTIHSEQQLRDSLTDIDIQSLSAVELSYRGFITGQATLLFHKDGADALATLLLGDETPPLDPDLFKIGILQEAGNIVLNGVLGAISNFFGASLDYLPPIYEEGDFDSLILSKSKNAQASFIVARTHFMAEQTTIEGDIVLILDASEIETLLRLLELVMEKKLPAGEALKP
ncbi:MAG: chemotaxis protein CheC [Desulfovibrionaceae bacterium]|nr:chemotaxis protein CheC [Desulfovibrionaceae bacterium]MBF0514966.1 chemotaxis protein CheC [Desulfovibrionaceae bacterium]